MIQPTTEQAQAYAKLDWLIRRNVVSWFDLVEPTRDHARRLAERSSVTHANARHIGEIVRAADRAITHAFYSVAMMKRWTDAKAIEGVSQIVDRTGYMSLSANIRRVLGDQIVRDVDLFAARIAVASIVVRLRRRGEDLLVVQIAADLERQFSELG